MAAGREEERSAGKEGTSSKKNGAVKELEVAKTQGKGGRLGLREQKTQRKGKNTGNRRSVFPKGVLRQQMRTWERAMLAATLDKVVIATDDEKIAECCLGFGADVVMTPESCRNGTERCNEALRKLKKKYDIVVNIQGDEPLIEPEIIDGVVKALQGAPDAVFSTAVTSLNPEDALDPNRVKCVVNKHGYAIYFSRGLIPFNKTGKVNPNFPYHLHLGIQSYDAKFLGIYPNLHPTPLQLEEDLEQLKVLENGYKMKVIKVDHEAHGVDVPSDVAKIEAFMRERNIP